jgi:hypothetical protein
MLTVAEVRQALFHLRHEWYESMSPDKPFLVSAHAIPASAIPTPAHSSTAHSTPAAAIITTPHAAAAPTPPIEPAANMTIAQFACLFDYGQHLKRHQRLTPRIIPVASHKE